MTTAVDLGTVDLNADAAKAGVVALNASLDTLSAQLPRTEANVSRLRAGFTQFRQQVGQSLANNLVQQLSQHTQELTRDMTGLERSAANVGIAALGQLGPLGQLAQGALGVYGMIAAAEREQIANQRTLVQLYDQQARLGPLYTNIASSIASTATAQERLNQTIAVARGLLSQQATLLGQGFNRQQIDQFARSVDGALASVRASQGALTANVQTHEVMAAILARNIGQLRQWGIALDLGENNTLNLARATVLLNNRAIESAQSAVIAARAAHARARGEVEAARQVRGGAAAIAAAVTAHASMQRTATALAAAERDLTSAVERQTGAVGANAQATIELAEERERLMARAAMAQDEADKRARRPSGVTHSAEEVRNLRLQIGLALERTRGTLLHARHIALSISPMQELVALEARRAHFEAQRHHTFAQRQRYLADLTREIELRNTWAEQERAIRTAIAETERTRAEAQRARETAAVDALIEQQRTREREAMEADGARKGRESEVLASAVAAADAITNGPMAMLEQSGKSLTNSLGGAYAAIVNGSKSVGAAVQEALQATMEAVASESFGKALFEGASALAALAGGNVPGAILHGKAAAGFAATAAVAGGLAAGGAALSSQSSAPSAGAGSGASPSSGLPSGPRGGSGGGAMPPITINYNAPVIGGRDAMAWETGTRMGRYLEAADSRVRRTPALMGG